MLTGDEAGPLSLGGAFYVLKGADRCVVRAESLSGAKDAVIEHI
jgi:hypothetical protein